ncbi:MAG: hypothetical protein M3T96_04940 [Acidobacteriota bacterium]|nr:hypothetical protein [Acidobacteriota bacterium]
MEHDKMEKRSRNHSMENHKCESSAAATAWKIVGGTALALVAAAVIVSLPDIKRYIKISTM